MVDIEELNRQLVDKYDLTLPQSSSQDYTVEPVDKIIQFTKGLNVCLRTKGHIADVKHINYKYRKILLTNANKKKEFFSLIIK